MFGIADAVKQEQKTLFGKRLNPTVDTWVSRNKDGQMEPVKVTAMTDGHLVRWIQYFRKKWRDSGFSGTNAQLDAAIQADIITAPAIYAEAVRRGIFKPAQDGGAPPPAPTTVVAPAERPATLGIRRIDLKDD